MREFSHPIAAVKERAKALLEASDVTFARCLEDGKTWPDSWKAYRIALRTVARDGGVLPARPAYP